MNKEYTYIDGKAIIKDEMGNQTPIEYYDNLDKVLVQENLIESMQNEIKKLEEESKEYKKNSKKRYIPIILPLGSLITIFGVPALFYLFGYTNIYSSTISTIFGSMNETLLYSSVFYVLSLPITGIIEYNMYCVHKNFKKEEKGINSKLEFLKKQIVIEKQYLNQLVKNKSNENDNQQFRVVKVNDLQALRNLKSCLELYYDLGYNDEKYYKYLEEGKLNDKLSKYYTEDSVEVAKEYLKEKGPTLVKKKKQK